MTAVLVTISEVLEAVETDLPDAALQRIIDGAEDDIRHYLSKDQLASLPVIVWEGRYTPSLGVPDGSLTLPESVLGFPLLRFEGTVVLNTETPTYTADTEELVVAGGFDTITPVTAEGITVAEGAFVATIDSTGLILTVDTLLTTAAVTVTRILGLQATNYPVQMVIAVMELVQLGVLRRGINTERVGQYTVSLKDYRQERGNVLARLLFSSGDSLAA